MAGDSYTVGDIIPFDDGLGAGGDQASLMVDSINGIGGVDTAHLYSGGNMMYSASFSCGPIGGTGSGLEITAYTDYIAAISALTGTVYPSLAIAGNVQIADCNFGATPFAYSVPAGFNAGVYV